MYFLGIEIGHSGTRAVALNLESAVIRAESWVPHGWIEGLPTGYRERNPAQWIDAVRQCLATLDGQKERLAAIGVESAAAECLGLKQYEPYHFQRATSMLAAQDFIAYWLTGGRGTEAVELGSAGVIVGVGDAPVVDYRGEITALCNATGAWLGLATTTNAAVAPEVLRSHYGWTPEQFEARVASVSPGAAGLLLLPYFTGESIPRLPDGKGIVHGMTPENFTPAHMARATAEGVALGFGYAMSRLRDLGFDPPEIRLLGPGGDQSGNASTSRRFFRCARGASLQPPRRGVRCCDASGSRVFPPVRRVARARGNRQLPRRCPSPRRVLVKVIIFRSR